MVVNPRGKGLKRLCNFRYAEAPWSGHCLLTGLTVCPTISTTGKGRRYRERVVTTMPEGHMRGVSYWPAKASPVGEAAGGPILLKSRTKGGIMGAPISTLSHGKPSHCRIPGGDGAARRLDRDWKDDLT